MIKALRYQLNLFYLSLSFFSRLPVPKSVEYSPELLNHSGRYFSLVGLLLATILAGIYLVIQPYFSDTISMMLLFIFSLLLTGAFHEDGLADMADGIGGGLTIAQRLAIMKDSRIGTYGAVSLFMALALKLMLLIELAQQQVVISSLLLAYGLSRALAASLIFDMTYVSEKLEAESEEKVKPSKSKPLASKQSLFELFILISIGLLPLLLFPLQTCLVILVVLLIFRTLFKKWLAARIGGYTGDCLGACQQISELLIYLVIIATAVSHQVEPSLSSIAQTVRL